MTGSVAGHDGRETARDSREIAPDGREPTSMTPTR
jgi:hypothetical protein